MTTQRTTDQLTDWEFNWVMSCRRNIVEHQRTISMAQLDKEEVLRSLRNSDTANPTHGDQMALIKIERLDLDVKSCEANIKDHYAQIEKTHEFPPVPGAEKPKKKRGRKPKAKVAESIA